MIEKLIEEREYQVADGRMDIVAVIDQLLGLLNPGASTQSGGGGGGNPPPKPPRP